MIDTPAGYVTIPSAGIIIIALAPVLALMMMVLIRNWKRLPDMWNLTFRRARTVQADIHTSAGRIITKYVVPDERGFFRYRKAAYHFIFDISKNDARYNVPRLTYIENQVEPEMGLMAESTFEIPVVTIADDGSKTTTQKKVSQHLITLSGIKPKLLPIVKRNDYGQYVILDEPPATAKEVGEAFDTKIVSDCANASIADLKMEQIFWIVLIFGVINLLVGIALYAKLNSMGNAIDILTHELSAAKGIPGV